MLVVKGFEADATMSPSMPTWDAQVRPYAAVAELKIPEKLCRSDGQPLPLVSLFKKKEPSRQATSVRRILRQLFTRMAATGVPYAWLSCYEYTWLAWWPIGEPSCLRLSRPFKRDTAAPGGTTAIAALSWLHKVALDSWSAGHRHPFKSEGVSCKPGREHSLDPDRNWAPAGQGGDKQPGRY